MLDKSGILNRYVPVVPVPFVADNSQSGAFNLCQLTMLATFARSSIGKSHVGDLSERIDGVDSEKLPRAHYGNHIIIPYDRSSTPTSSNATHS